MEIIMFTKYLRTNYIWKQMLISVCLVGSPQIIFHWIGNLVIWLILGKSTTSFSFPENSSCWFPWSYMYAARPSTAPISWGKWCFYRPLVQFSECPLLSHEPLCFYCFHHLWCTLLALWFCQAAALLSCRVQHGTSLLGAFSNPLPPLDICRHTLLLSFAVLSFLLVLITLINTLSFFVFSVGLRPP